MIKKQELKTVCKLWESLCELEIMLFDNYEKKFIDIHMEDCAKKQDKDDEQLLCDP